MKSVVLVFSAIARTSLRIPLQIAAIAFFATLLLAALVVHPAMAQAPGSTRVMIRNPDVGKWAGSRNFFSTSSSEFVCRPLACPAPSKVTARISSSPTRSPDRQALAKYASQTIPAAVEQANLNAASSLAPGRKIERLSSTATEMRGYPAIAQEMRFVGGKEPVYKQGHHVREIGAGRYRLLLAVTRDRAAQPRPVCRRDAGRGHSATAIKS